MFSFIRVGWVIVNLHSGTTVTKTLGDCDNVLRKLVLHRTFHHKGNCLDEPLLKFYFSERNKWCFIMGRRCAAGASGSSGTGLWAQICREVAERPRVPSARYFYSLWEGADWRLFTGGGMQSSAASAEDGTQGLSHARQTLCHWLSYKLDSAFFFLIGK